MPNLKNSALSPAEQPPVEVKRGPHRYQVGHKGTGGRPLGSPLAKTKTAREIAENLGFHPVHWLVRVALGFMPNADGSEDPIEDKNMRLDAGKTVSKFLVPTLSAQAITGAEGGPIAVASIDLNKLLLDPQALEAAQNLSLHISGIEPPVETVDATPDE